jgi:hypothetical protein
VGDTAEGPITVVSLDALSSAVSEKQQQMEQLAVQINNARRTSADVEARAGWILTYREMDWPSTDRAERIAAARGFGDHVKSLESSLNALKTKPHRGLGGLIRRAGDAMEARKEDLQLADAQGELANRYRAVAEGLTVRSGIAEADELLDQVRQANNRIVELTTQQVAIQAAVATLSAELSKRKDVQSRVGFDALGLLADLDVNGIRPVSTSLVLKKGEMAAAELSATLCRHKTRTSYVGGSQGVSVPLGHGFRYRVGSFHGRPIQSEYLAQIDQGKLVLTNQRLVFLGGKRDVVVPLSKLLNVEPFADAVSVAREGKETQDIYLVAKPQYLMIYLDWLISHPG